MSAADTFEMEAAMLALTAVDECDGDPHEAIAELSGSLIAEEEPLDADERAVVERALALIRERAGKA